MNSGPQTLELSPPAEEHLDLEEPRPGNSAQSKIEKQKSNAAHPLLGNPNRGRGKVARLPKAVRDQLNNMILDGLPYPEIIQRLGGDTKHLKPDHLHQWKKHGYKNWLVE